MKRFPFILLSAPTTNMMRTGHYPWLDGFRHPNFVYEPADFCGDFEQVSIIHTETFCIFGMNPNGISMGNFCEPFCIGRARVNMSRESKIRKQHALIFVLIHFI